MKSYSKIALLVVIALLLSTTACTLKASTPSAVPATPSGEAPFPFTTPGDVGAFGTQTALAQTPASTTPQVVVATDTPGAEAQQQGGGQATEAAPQTQPEAQAQPQAAVNTPEVVRPTNYTLQKGEWPICIARRYNLDLASFFSANGMNMNSKPAAGTSLRIPASGNWSANYGARSLKTHPATYTAVAGDTVYSIACRYGDVTPDGILAVNGLSSPSDIKAGMSLKIP